MEDALKVRFVPKNRFGKYDCAVEIVRMGRFCKIFLRPEKEGGDVNPDSLHELMNVANFRQGQSNGFWVNNVFVQRTIVPEHEIELLNQKHKYLSFDEAVEFFSKIKSFKKV